MTDHLDPQDALFPQREMTRGELLEEIRSLRAEVDGERECLLSFQQHHAVAEVELREARAALARAVNANDGLVARARKAQVWRREVRRLNKAVAYWRLSSGAWMRNAEYTLELLQKAEALLYEQKQHSRKVLDESVALKEVLGCDAAGRTVVQLLREASQALGGPTSGPLAQCLWLKADELAALEGQP